MAPPPKPPVVRAAQPRQGAVFDPWNSSSAGHQRAEQTPGTGWRDSRNRKLNAQFRAGGCGGNRLSDTWGAGADGWNDQLRAVVPKALLERRGNSVLDLLQRAKSKSVEATTKPPPAIAAAEGGNGVKGENPGSEQTAEERLTAQRKAQDGAAKSRLANRRVLDGVVIFVNGSTFPLVSDHKLKHIVSEHGGNISCHLGRRKVTHVVVGRTSASGLGGGGGLAGGKLDKEIRRMRGCGVKFVDVEWILESVKVGKRVPEARFAPLKPASSGQRSVYRQDFLPVARDEG